MCVLNKHSSSVCKYHCFAVSQRSARMEINDAALLENTNQSISDFVKSLLSLWPSGARHIPRFITIHCNVWRGNLQCNSTSESHTSSGDRDKSWEAEYGKKGDSQEWMLALPWGLYPSANRVTSAPTVSSRVWFSSCPASPVGSYSYCCSSCTFSRATRTVKYHKYGGQQQNSPLLQTISRHKEVEVGQEGTEPPSCCRDSEVPFAKRADRKSHSSEQWKRWCFEPLLVQSCDVRRTSFSRHSTVTQKLQGLYNIWMSEGICSTWDA